MLDSPGEALAGFLRRHKSGEVVDLLHKGLDVCDPAAGREEGKHRLVVGGIPKEDDLFLDGFIVGFAQDFLDRKSVV